ncbi:hypothetical protein F5B20DRAFT_577955 [Whalleya microplaca]|nr:hypothetical protein F5B20DRAFT_577955 [Whalleya microplaca]
MELQYQCLSILGKGSLFCAAKGPSIHTFDPGAEPPFLSSWTHPLANRSENGKPQETAREDEQEDEKMTDQPPVKRRKLDAEGEPNVEAKAEAESKAGQGGDETPEGAPNGKDQKKKQPKTRQPPPRLELPFMILLTATEDGSHVVAVTGQDKTLWVFEHDGKGSLKELSQRVMPKRPSALALTSYGATILCADKFGDVYAVPLIVPAIAAATTTAPSETTTTTTTTTPTPTPAPAPIPRRGANTLTVHTERNMRALEDQRKHLSQRKDTSKDAGPAFAHELVLGHVSMLTALTMASCATESGRPYIITGDRDEHIRVSRGLPQAHVIETYCLGHAYFVSALCAPRSRPDVVVSGGGDDDLFVWDWRAGRLWSRAGLLGLVREVIGAEENRIAVTKLCSYDVDAHCYIIAVCERVPALFVFELEYTPLEQRYTTLGHVQTLNLPGNPLDVAVLRSSTVRASGLVVAIDPAPSTSSSSSEDAALAGGDSLLLFEPDATTKTPRLWAPRGSIQGGASAAVADVDISREELEKVLYPVKNLRKTEFEDDAEGGEQSAKGGSARGSVAP